MAVAIFLMPASAQPGNPADASQLNFEGLSLVSQQSFEAARAKFKSALNACESPLPACPDLIVILSNLGGTSYALGEYATAKPFLHRATDLLRQCAALPEPGGDAAGKPHTPCPREIEDTTLHNLAAVYWAEGRPADSIPFYERSLQLRSARKGPSDFSLAPLLTGLAMAYRDSGDYAHARAITDTAIAMAGPHSTEETADVATNAVVLGSVLESQGRLAQADEWLGRGLALRKKLFGAASLPVADALLLMAVLDRHEDRLSEAVTAYRGALRIYEGEHATGKSATTLLDLAKVLGDQGKVKESERIYREVIAAVERRAGPMDPELAAVVNGLADLMFNHHRYREADPLLRRALAIDRANFAPDDLRIASDLSSGGTLAMELKQFDTAEDLFQQSLNILKRRLSGDHVEVGKVLAKLAEVRRRQHRVDDSVALYQKSVQILEGALGPDDPELLSTLTLYSTALRANHDYVGAGRLDLQCMRIRVIQARSKASRPAEHAG
jgi:tetratricopeptide (TPR) repeat protein